MRTVRLLCLFILFPALFLACGSKDEDKPLGGVPSADRMPGLGEAAPAVVFQAPESDLVGLIPAEACGVVYVPSANALFEKMREVVGKIDPEAAGELQTDQVLGEMFDELSGGTLTPDMIDMDRPMALAVIMKERRGEPQPLPVLILPVSDMAAATSAIEQARRKPSYKTTGDYLSVCPAPDMPLEGGGDLGGDMPAGDLVLRADLALLTKMFGNDIKGAFGEGVDEGVAGAPPGLDQMADAIKGGWAKFVDSAEGLDLCVSLDSDMLNLHCFFTAKEGSALASASAPAADMMNLAGCLPADYPMAFLMSFDMSKMGEWVKPFMDLSMQNMPPEVAEKFGEFWEKSMAMTRHLDNGLAAAISFGEEGMEMVEVVAAKDAKAYIADMESMMSEDIAGALKDTGMDLIFGEKTQVAGHEVHNWTMKFDAKKLMAGNPGAGDMPTDQLKMMEGMFDRMLGEGGMRFRIAAVEDKIVMTVGGDDALLEKALAAAAASGNGPSGSLGAAMERIGATPKFMMHMELRGFMSQMMSLVRDIMPPDQRDEVPEMPAGGAIPFSVYYTGSGRNHAMGTSLDIAGILDVVKYFSEMK